MQMMTESDNIFETRILLPKGQENTNSFLTDPSPFKSPAKLSKRIISGINKSCKVKKEPLNSKNTPNLNRTHFCCLLNKWDEPIPH